MQFQCLQKVMPSGAVTPDAVRYHSIHCQSGWRQKLAAWTADPLSRMRTLRGSPPAATCAAATGTAVCVELLRPSCTFGLPAACGHAGVVLQGQALDSVPWRPFPWQIPLAPSPHTLWSARVNTSNLLPLSNAGFTLKPWNYFDGLASRHVPEAPHASQCAPQADAAPADGDAGGGGKADALRRLVAGSRGF